MAQQKFSFDVETIKKIGKGIAIALGGATGVYILQCITQADFGNWTPAIVAVISILINVCREYVKGSSGSNASGNRTEAGN